MRDNFGLAILFHLRDKEGTGTAARAVSNDDEVLSEEFSDRWYKKKYVEAVCGVMY